MRRLLALSVLLWLVGWGALAQVSPLSSGAGPWLCQLTCNPPLGPFSATVNVTGGSGGGGGGSYSGPADVVANPILFYGLRAVSASYASSNGKLLNIVRASDSHACDVLAASTGGMGLTANCGTGGDNGQSASSFCNSTTCATATLYDQSGALACGGVACDLSQATSANRPALTFNCINTSLPCISFSSSGPQFLSRSSSPTQAQPYTWSTVSQYVGGAGICNPSNTCVVFVSDSAGNYIGEWFNDSTNLFKGLGGGGTSISFPSGVSASTWYSTQFIFSGASTVIYLNGTTSSPGTPGASGMANTLAMGDDTFTEPLNGKISEFGAWGSGFSGAQNKAMCQNDNSLYALGLTCN